MARMHSRDKGKSGSTRPSNPRVPSWLSYKPKEVELLVLKYAREGLSPSKIGIRLRDHHGIPDVKLVTRKSITKILEEKGLLKEIPEDLMALIAKIVKLKKHMEENHKDMSGKRGLQLTESKLLRLVKYYKRTGRLPADWKYDPSRLELYLE